MTAISDRLNRQYDSGYANQILDVTGAAADAVIRANTRRSIESNPADDDFHHSIGHQSDDDRGRYTLHPY